MNIISNNCIGGFIYRDILKTKYETPFIWSAMEHNEFFELCENLRTVNLNDIQETIDTKSIYTENRSALLIDKKYTLAFHHVWKDDNYNTPTIIKEWGNGINVKYKDPFEYIKAKYIQRLARMNLSNPIIFCFYDAGKPTEDVYKIWDACEKQKAYGIVITEVPIENKSNKVLVLKSENSWNTEPLGWAPSLLKAHSQHIKDFLSAASLTQYPLDP